MVLGDNGLPSFNALQKAFDRGAGKAQIVYFLFDVPYFEGYDLRDAALASRRQLLKALLDEKATEHVRFSAAFEADAASVLEFGLPHEPRGRHRQAGRCALRLTPHGDLARARSASSARSSWSPATRTGRTAPPQIGSLLLGVHGPDGTLVSVGSVGTGWDVEARPRR